jgi:hypothetical protein
MVLKTPFCETAHIVRSPTAKKLNEYRRSVVKSIELPHNQEELRYRTGAAVDLYDAVAVSNEGYFQGTEVPSHHKFAVVGELVNAIDEIDPPFVPNEEGRSIGNVPVSGC